MDYYQCCDRHNSDSNSTKITWDLGLSYMLDRWMEKMIESATSAYLPKVEEKAKMRKAELEEMKAKVRTDPEQVEKWFNKEIDKLQNIDIKEIMKDATAGI